MTEKQHIVITIRLSFLLHGAFLGEGDFFMQYLTVSVFVICFNLVILAWKCPVAAAYVYII
jgi:hypothetical protein